MELTFDEMAVDTTIAKCFLKTIEQNGGYKLSQWYDGSEYYETDQLPKYAPSTFQFVNEEKIHNLACKLKENVNLLAQLEYLSRDIPIEDSKAQINIIIRQLEHLYAYNRSVTISYNDEETRQTIDMCKDSPLLMLGYVAKALLSRVFWIQADQATAAICILFTQLCHEAGLPVFTFICETLMLSDIKAIRGERRWVTVAETVAVLSGKEFSLYSEPCQNLAVGTLGVISEHSDVDSAVDIFLNSSTKAPWRLQRILVQESVSQQFKYAMAWKCKQNESSNTMVYKGRIFHLDQLGPNDPEQNEIYIDTYRTTKELLSLLADYPSYYLSLWANNIAEINEITHSVSTPIVWVNNFAEFRGPAKITEAIYPNAEIEAHKVSFNKTPKLNELMLLRISWLKLSIESRLEIIAKVLKSSDLTEVKWIASVMNCTDGSYVYMGKDYVCSALPTASSKPFLLKNAEKILKTTEFFESIAQGNAFLVHSSNIDNNLIKICDELKNAGVPIVSIEYDGTFPALYGLTFYVYDMEFYKHIARPMKIIWTNSGTTFAN